MRLSLPSVLSAQTLSDPVTRRYLGITMAACLVDLATKWVAVRSLGEWGLYPLSERFWFTLVWNTGAAGGVSIGPFTWLINVIVTVAALYLVMTVVRPMAAVDPRATISLGLVSGGAFGNLFSIVAGPRGVADFIAIRLTEETTMVANVADLFLWAGALMLVPVGATLVRLVRAERAEHAERRSAVFAIDPEMA